MNKRKFQYLPGVLLLALGSVPLLAQVNIPNTFASGETAVAAEVNANFQALEDGLNDALLRINTLESELAQAQTALDEAQNVLALNDYVELVPDDNILNEYTVRFSGVNLQIVNGEGQTESVNGLGNLIVGYNEARNLGTDNSICSDGQYDNQTDCVDNSELWQPSHKSGSHNLIVGHGNAYSQYGGIVAGEHSAINRGHASVTGGWVNVASGSHAAVAGGQNNVASGHRSAVLGGYDNSATYANATVSGGRENTASGTYSSVSGGIQNTASGRYSSVSGGEGNTAYGIASSILGGQNESATSDYQTIP
ncbi:hypothetical protein [Thiohalophilus sp.]|uniref:hypothetical protein n=1 Tax=Thiohalophilus sp. TaxID=3028392 RepID=UPI002ACD760C|nr:hypothetical protein [Thiohalophilus sp.]MDZ7661643.1 hypothetical protein [Thiohalophilus sp.]